MGQVPKKLFPYLIVGKGRLANHFKHYFSLLKIPHLNWFRNYDTPFNKLYNKAEKILVLINDDDIEYFINTYKKDDKKIWIHCSGMLSTPLAESAHPLMTFADKLYDRETYEQITFVTEKEKLPFTKLFPELNNRNFAIPAEKKPLYHAWCVISGNYTTLLWKWFFEELEGKFGIKPDAAHLYLKQIAENLTAISAPLTGPLARNDMNVIEKHLNELEGEPFKQVYEAFVQAYTTLHERETKRDNK